MTATITRPVTGTATTTLHPTAQKFWQIMAELGEQFLEREELILCSVLGVLTNEGTFILGEPGTGKSKYCRAFYGRIIGGLFYEKALASGTPVEALVGGINVPRLTTEGVWVRRSEGTLITATWALLDEVSRANGLVTDELLPILNERVTHEVDPVTGASVRPIPLRSFMSGNNFLPTEENEGAAAFWDRNLIRVQVKKLREMANIVRMLETGARPVANPTTIGLDEVVEAADVLVPNVRIPRDVLFAAATLRVELGKKQIEVSDRRLTQCMKLVQAHAFLNGRDEATSEDLAVLQHALWDDPSHIREVHRLATTVSNPLGDDINNIADRIEELAREMRKIAQNPDKNERSAEYTKQMGNANIVGTEIDEAMQKAKRNGYSTKAIDELSNRLGRTRQDIMDTAMANMKS